jgi:hypothetical protein
MKNAIFNLKLNLTGASMAEIHAQIEKIVGRQFVPEVLPLQEVIDFPNAQNPLEWIKSYREVNAEWASKTNAYGDGYIGLRDAKLRCEFLSSKHPDAVRFIRNGCTGSIMECIRQNP